MALTVASALELVVASLGLWVGVVLASLALTAAMMLAYFSARTMGAAGVGARRAPSGGVASLGFDAQPLTLWLTLLVSALANAALTVCLIPVTLARNAARMPFCVVITASS